LSAVLFAPKLAPDTKGQDSIDGEDSAYPILVSVGNGTNDDVTGSKKTADNAFRDRQLRILAYSRTGKVRIP
jgi:hypothetical protein